VTPMGIQAVVISAHEVISETMQHLTIPGFRQCLRYNLAEWVLTLVTSQNAAASAVG